MKRLIPFLLLTCGLALTPILTAKDAPPRFKTIEVKHFTVAEGVPISQDFVNFFYDGLRTVLPKQKLAERIVEEGAVVPEAEAADSMVVEGTFTGYNKGGFGHGIGRVNVEIRLYRRSDHSVIKTIVAQIPFKPSPFNKDKNVGEFTGGRASFEIERALQ